MTDDFVLTPSCRFLSFAPVLSKAARKRRNKKNRALEDSSKPLDAGKKGGDLLNFLNSNKTDEIGNEAIGGTIEGDKIATMLNTDIVTTNQLIPPPPGLGFTPNSKKGAKKKNQNRSKEIIQSDGSSSDEEEEDGGGYFISKISGFSVRM